MVGWAVVGWGCGGGFWVGIVRSWGGEEVAASGMASVVRVGLGGSGFNWPGIRRRFAPSQTLFFLPGTTAGF